MHFVGVDIGSIYIKTVVLDEDQQPLHTSCAPHKGNPRRAFALAIQAVPSDSLVAVTGILQAGYPHVDLVRARIRGVRHIHHAPQIRNIIDIGGGSLTLIELDDDGTFRNFSTNSLCAAGTGSFLDEQAGRMGLSYEEIGRFEVDTAPPPIATRCAVFAKSDLIHRQQEGHTRSAMWSGLCRGMVSTMLQTLLKGRRLSGGTAVIGGVARNRVVLHWLTEELGDLMVKVKDPHLVAAHGAALILHENEQAGLSLPIATATPERIISRQKPLLLHRSRYPDFAVSHDFSDEMGTEVRVSRLPHGAIRCWLGIDIGSTSTKAVLLGEEGRIILDLYRRTMGAPIEAVKVLLASIEGLMERYECTFDILGTGTTGSGRKLIGHVFGADVVINEITAHVTGAAHIDPAIDTIFEIGGQDAKYIRTKRGCIADSNMNYVCAAGTGSFVEEQARRLGVDLREIGERVMGIAPPVTSDRCTVFMEQDVADLIRKGYSSDECLAAVLYSVVQNYLNRVVGNRYVSRRKVFFQGATARNKGLVAAFENLLDVEMVVSPYCHVMGAVGVALCAQNEMRASGTRSRFLGLGMAKREVTLSKGECRLCQNVCAITFAHIGGADHAPSWGYLCGRDPDDAKVRRSPHADLLSWRQKLWHGGQKAASRASDQKEGGPLIGIPRALSTYALLPLWQTFFGELGCRVLLSPSSDEMIKDDGIRLVGADFCYPVKLMHGHVKHLFEREVDSVFLPHMISDEKNRFTTNSLYCPYVEAAPSVVNTALSLQGNANTGMLRPVVDFRNIPATVKELTRCLAPMGIDRQSVRKAWKKAMEARKEFTRTLMAKGAEALEALDQEDQIGIVLIGRTYNLYDTGANLRLPQKIAEYGHTVIPLDLLPFDPEELGPEFGNLYWSSGQRIIAALKTVRRHPRLFAVCFTNFSCGPDSFLLSYAEDVMDGKPLLVLELDEHGADAGYMTRIEAFLDVLRQSATPREPAVVHAPQKSDNGFRDRRILVPPIHPLGSRLFASAFRKHGYDSEALPGEDEESFSLGREVCRGSECLPTPLTVGVLLRYLREHPNGRFAYFMPTTDGPCRFGQYRLFQQIVLAREGHDIPILSPSAGNSYAGLDSGLRRDLWRATLLGDLLFKMGCRVRPTELRKGDTDALVEESARTLEAAFEGGQDLAAALRKIAGKFAVVPRGNGHPRPLVGIVGEIYIRSNPFSNQNLVRAVEDAGGEAWLSPISEWILYTSALAGRKAVRNRNLFEIAGSLVKNHVLHKDEDAFFTACRDVLADRREPSIEKVLDAGLRYLPLEFQGEAVITVGRAALFREDGVALVINVAPFGCMPGTISAALFKEIEKKLRIPVLSLFYEGAGELNDRVGVFLRNLGGGAVQDVAREAKDGYTLSSRVPDSAP